MSPPGLTWRSSKPPLYDFSRRYRLLDARLRGHDKKWHIASFTGFPASIALKFPTSTSGLVPAPLTSKPAAAMTISSARQRACASHFGAELGGGKTHGEREHGPANDDAETKAPRRETKPDRGDDNSGRRCPRQVRREARK